MEQPGEGPGRAFDDRQRSLVERIGRRGPFDLTDGTLVVLPSITFPAEELRKIIAIQHYEERLLFLTLLLRSEGLRMVFLTSCEIDEAVVDYYLGFLPDPQSARSRLTLGALGDPLPRALSTKLLERPGALEELRERIPDRDNACLLTFNVTKMEQQIGEALGIPLYGPDPSLVPLGSKSGSRLAAREAEVPVLEGAEDLYSLLAVEEGIGQVREHRPDAEAVVVKLNNGFSGQGNAIIELTDVRSPLDSSQVVFCASEESWPSFSGKIEAEGAIVEELVRPHPTSPSVQLQISATGEVAVTSTHDQILGGPDDQVYLGCRFPARADYRGIIAGKGERVARYLAEQGVVGPFGIDFVVLPGATARPRCMLSEINLRMGGTTHPFHMARLVTGGEYDADTGELIADGRSKCYVATDNLKSERYIGMTPNMVIDRLQKVGLAFDPHTKVGTTLHLLGALEGFGKLGMVCIADSPDAAQELFEQSVAEVDELALD